MSSITKKNRIYTSDELWARIGGTLLVALGVVLALWWVGNHYAGLPNDALMVRVLSGQAEWTPTHTRVATVAATLAVAAALVFLAIDTRLYGKRKKITRAAKHLAQPQDTKDLQARARRKEGKRLGDPRLMPMIGFLARTRTRLYMGPEDTGLVITGPRQNKSSSLANPFILEAPGAVVATSNKPDVVKQTMKRRLKAGAVFIFDPLGIYAGHNPNPMYWDPLSYIYEAPDHRMVERAMALAQRFIFASGAAAGGENPHWRNAARDIAGAMMLAASIDRRPITEVYSWVLAPNDTTPLAILERDARFPVMARMLSEYRGHGLDQRSGEYGTAQTALGFLAYDTVRPWITKTPGRTEFRPKNMSQGAATLYLLSKGGDATAGALTAALTIAVYEAADKAADEHGGRLEVPMLFVLDEVANVCRWEELPDLYTHAGSKGIIFWSFLQNYPQGKHVWGEERMKVLLDAASIFITGGNIKDSGYHRAVAGMIDKVSKETVSESWGKHGRSTNRQSTEVEILSPGDLRGMPKEYSMMFCANVPPILLRHVPVWRRHGGERGGSFSWSRLLRRTDEQHAPHPVTAPVVHRDYDQGPAAPSRTRRPSGFALHVEDGS